MDLSIRKFAIGAVISDVVATVQPLLGQHGNTVELSVPDSGLVINCDPVKLRQILLNLISNAARFTTRGVVRLQVERRGETVQFRVQDTGIGMTREQIEKLFVAFSQLHPTKQAGGTGLGLVISQHLCRLMGGDISVESEMGKGSAFTVSLPLNCAPQAQAAH